MATFEKINFPRYVMDHLCWAINEGINKGRKQVPYGRLLSEIFNQGRVLKTLKMTRDASDECFKASAAEKTISSKSLHSMHLFKKAPQDEKWLEMITAESEILRDFPSIIKESNPEILAETVAAYVIETDANPQEEAAPAKVKGKKAKAVTVSEAVADAKPKKKKVDAASIPTKKGIEKNLSARKSWNKLLARKKKKRKSLRRRRIRLLHLSSLLWWK
jgi:hypothetical protein